MKICFMLLFVLYIVILLYYGFLKYIVETMILGDEPKGTL